MARNKQSALTILNIVVPIVTFAIGAIVAYFIVINLAQMNKDFSFKITKDGTAEIAVSADENFAEIVDKAMLKDPDSVAAILASRNYYFVTDSKLVHAIENIDTSAPDAAVTAEKFREMLWDLRGPFKLPGTLRGADKSMVDALTDLDRQIGKPGVTEANGLLTELWIMMINQAGIFRARPFDVSVSMLKETGTEMELARYVFSCPGGPLPSGTMIQLYIPGTSGEVFAEVIHDPSMLDCEGSILTAQQLLAGGRADFALTQVAYKDLTNPEATSVVEDRNAEARFVVYPKDLIHKFRNTFYPASDDKAPGDCYHNGEKVPEGTRIGPVVCENGKWVERL